MNEELKQFDFQGASVRVVVREGEPWWVAQDVCRVLDLVNTSQAVAALIDSEKGICEAYTLGGPQQVAIVSEPGLYRLIFKSRKPEAQAFQYWVVHEVLPAILHTGKYDAKGMPIIELLEAAAKELRAKDAQLALQAPKVESFDKLINAEGLYSFEQAAKILWNNKRGYGQNRLIKELEYLNVVYHHTNSFSGRREVHPYQAQVDAGRFVLKTGTYDRNAGQARTYTVTKVTPKGLDWLRVLLARQEAELFALDDNHGEN
jgi:prophage antirepressor-like protein